MAPPGGARRARKALPGPVLPKNEAEPKKETTAQLDDENEDANTYVCTNPGFARNQEQGGESSGGEADRQFQSYQYDRDRRRRRKTRSRRRDERDSRDRQFQGYQSYSSDRRRRRKTRSRRRDGRDSRDRQFQGYQSYSRDRRRTSRRRRGGKRSNKMND